MGRHTARVLVVEDDATIRHSLELAFRRAGYDVQSEADGISLADLAETFRPDLAVLDVRLPWGPDGFEIARQLRRTGDLPILFVTAGDSLQARLTGFDAGGDDYLVKPFELEELLARARALLRRSGRLTSQILRVGDLVIEESAHVATRNGTKLELTRTEYELLAVLARHPAQVLSKDQLLSKVWGFDAYDPNLVEVHMSSLRRKLEAFGPRLVHTVRGVGYVMRV